MAEKWTNQPGLKWTNANRFETLIGAGPSIRGRWIFSLFYESVRELRKIDVSVARNGLFWFWWPEWGKMLGFENLMMGWGRWAFVWLDLVNLTRDCWLCTPRRRLVLSSWIYFLQFYISCTLHFSLLDPHLRRKDVARCIMLCLWWDWHLKRRNCGKKNSCLEWRWATVSQLSLQGCRKSSN